MVSNKQKFLRKSMKKKTGIIILSFIIAFSALGQAWDWGDTLTKVFQDVGIFRIFSSGNPGAADSGTVRVYFDNNGLPRYMNSAGDSLPLGSGGNGSPEIYEVYDFEGSVDGTDFTCGSNFTVSNETSNPLNGKKSIVLAQAATPPTVGTKCVSPNIAVPIGARGKKNFIRVPINNGFNDDEIAVNVIDKSNSDAELGQMILKKSSTKSPQTLYFIPSDDAVNPTEEIAFEFEVLVQNASTSAALDNIYFQDEPDNTEVYGVVSSVRTEGTAGDPDSVGGLIDFTEVYDQVGAWDGDEYTVQKTGGTISLKGHLAFSATSAVRQIYLYKNGSAYKRIGDNLINDESAYNFAYISEPSEFVAGDVLSIRNAGSASGNRGTGTDNNWLNIVEFNTINLVSVYGTSVNDVSNSNIFVAKLSSANPAVVSGENLDFIDGSTCTRANTNNNTINCSFNEGVFSTDPICVASPIYTTGNANFVYDSTATTSQVTIRQAEDSSTFKQEAATLVCVRTGDWVSESRRKMLFPNGFRTRFETKILSSDVTNTTSEPSEIQFTGLTIGKCYRIAGQVKLNVYQGAASIKFYSATAGVGYYGQVSAYIDGDSNLITHTPPNVVFQATTTSLFSRASASSGCSVEGNSTEEDTFITLMELDNCDLTTKF